MCIIRTRIKRKVGKMAVGTVAKVEELKELKDHHEQMVLDIAFGASNQDIAETWGMSPQQVSNIRNSPLVKEKLRELRERTEGQLIAQHIKLVGLGPAAIEHYQDVLERVDVSVGHKNHVADQVLDRIGLGRQQTMNVVQAGTHVTRTHIEEMKETVLEMARGAGILKDVTATDVTVEVRAETEEASSEQA